MSTLQYPVSTREYPDGRACPSVRLPTLAAPTCGTRKGTRGTQEYSRVLNGTRGVLTSTHRAVNGHHSILIRLLSVVLTAVSVGQCYTDTAVNARPKWEWPQLGVGPTREWA